MTSGMHRDPQCTGATVSTIITVAITSDVSSVAITEGGPGVHRKSTDFRIRQTWVQILFTSPFCPSLSLANLPTPPSSVRSGVSSSRKPSGSLRPLGPMPLLGSGSCLCCPHYRTSTLRFQPDISGWCTPGVRARSVSAHCRVAPGTAQGTPEALSPCLAKNTSSRRTTVLRSGDPASGPKWILNTCRVLMWSPFSVPLAGPLPALGLSGLICKMGELIAALFFAYLSGTHESIYTFICISKLFPTENSLVP